MCVDTLSTKRESHHIQIHNSNSSSQVVLIEDILKLNIEQRATLVVTGASPRIEETALELVKVRRAWR